MSAPQGGASSSFTDLMASLLAVFVLLFVVAQNKSVGDRNKDRDLLIRQLRGELRQAGIDSAAVMQDPRDPNSVVVVFPDSLFFLRGEEQMLPRGQQIVLETTPRLTRVVCGPELRPRLDQIVVEGHTDNTIPYGYTPQLGRRYNLRLSQLRSMDYVAKSTEALANDDAALGCYLDLVSASGRGQEDPIKAAAGDAAVQRRVLLRIRLHAEVRDTLRLAATPTAP
jgi:flagellar motor protein MotB